jgi:peroxiredoxin
MPPSYADGAASLRSCLLSRRSGPRAAGHPPASCSRLRWLVASGRLARQEGHGRPMDPYQDAHQDRHLAPLLVGTPAPDFTLPQTHSTRLALHSLLGQPVVLVFYPLDWEPLSRDQLVLYQKFADAFERLGARLLGISVDHVYCHAAFARDAQLRFPLLADFQPRGGVARQYGVYRDGQGVSARALFVLDRQGRIRFSHAYPDFLNPGVDDVLTTLEALVVEDVEEAKRANDMTQAEDTEHAEPTEQVGHSAQTGADIPSPGSAEAGETPGGSKRDGDGTE